MIGTDLNLDLPTLSDTLATIVSKLVTALEAVGDSVAEKATPAALDINTALDLGGNSLTNVATLQLASGNSSSVAGSMFYYDGDFYAVDTVGIIKLTDSGAINAAGVGGIVGDYGGVNPAAVSYDDISGEYRFTEDTGVWADLVADDLILEGTNGSVRLGVDDAIVTDRTVNFKSLPAAGISPLVYDAAENSIEDGAVSRVTNTALFTSINLTGNFQHGTSAKLLSGLEGRASNPALISYSTNPAYVEALNAVSILFPVALQEGDRITDVTFMVQGNGVADVVADVFVTSADMSGDTNIGTLTVSNEPFAWGIYGISVTDTTLTSIQSLFVRFSCNAAGIKIGNVYVTYNRPA